MLVMTCEQLPSWQLLPPMQPFRVAFSPAPEKSHMKELASSFTPRLPGQARVDMPAVHSIVRIITNLPNAT